MSSAVVRTRNTHPAPSAGVAPTTPHVSRSRGRQRGDDPAVRSGSQGRSANDSAVFTWARSSHPLRRARVAARSAMGGASLPGDGGRRNVLTCIRVPDRAVRRRQYDGTDSGGIAESIRLATFHLATRALRAKAGESQRWIVACGRVSQFLAMGIRGPSQEMAGSRQGRAFTVSVRYCWHRLTGGQFMADARESTHAPDQVSSASPAPSQTAVQRGGARRVEDDPHRCTTERNSGECHGPNRSPIFLVEKDGLHLRYAAAPNLPESYRAAIDGMAIGPAAGPRSPQPPLGSAGAAAPTGTSSVDGVALPVIC